MARRWALGLALAALLTGCGGGGDHASVSDPRAPRVLTVSSPAFDDGEAIPTTYTCQGDGTSPPLHWSGIPAGATDVALVVDDPDAPDGGYVHWVVVGIPARVGRIDAGALPGGATELDGTGGRGWRPPCPPSGTHHYRFTVYALPSGGTRSLDEHASVHAALAAITDRAVAWGRLTGTATASGGDSGGGGY